MITKANEGKQWCGCGTTCSTVVHAGSLNAAFIDSVGFSRVAYPAMSHGTTIDRELAVAAEAWKGGNEGKARVCARRAVALAADAWLASLAQPLWGGDAVEHLRRIHRHAAFPLSVRQAAERLTTAVTRRHEAPFTSDPISDASLIISHLVADAKNGSRP